MTRTPQQKRDRFWEKGVRPRQGKGWKEGKTFPHPVPPAPKQAELNNDSKDHYELTSVQDPGTETKDNELAIKIEYKNLSKTCLIKCLTRCLKMSQI